MKRALAVLAILTMACVSAKAQSVFEKEGNSTYVITESTSLGGSVKMTENIAVGYNSGNISGKIVFNPRNKTIKFSGKKVSYDPAKFRIQEFEHFRLTSGRAATPNQEGDVIFQLIEDFENNTINFLIQWPDFSAVKVAATLEGN
ncbi:MAG: hypothetical protein MJY89_00840 [Bacteroidales bacterium]|nr:hypothetical protein [Bacteroidales bacterium]